VAQLFYEAGKTCTKTFVLLVSTRRQTQLLRVGEAGLDEVHATDASPYESSGVFTIIASPEDFACVCEETQKYLTTVLERQA